jgi:nucleoside-diphosphate-sugar epimerase
VEGGNEVRRVAIVGAAGFIGSRLKESFHSSGAYDVVPVVRRETVMESQCPCGVRPVIADALDEAALVAAFNGCDSVVSSIAGDPRTIVESARSIQSAAERVGVRRLIYLSSQMVHGQAPVPGTDEHSPLSLRQPIAYNAAKVRAERLLTRPGRRSRTEVVIIRPGIVYGPRSRWTRGIADELLAGKAFLADGGAGICNAIYVDNVVHAVERAIEAGRVAGEAFIVNDAETVTWRDLIRPIADALGVDLNAVPQPNSAEILGDRDSSHQSLLMGAARALVRLLPKRIAEAQRAARKAWQPPPEKTEEPATEYSLELALLHSCRVRLPTEKAERLLGFRPRVSFDEGCRRSVEWLRSAGYPVC